MTTSLPFEDLEKAYELIAEGIDEVGEEKQALFLAKLVLLLAHRTNDIEVIREAIASALADYNTQN
jgi:hypothetical protein